MKFQIASVVAAAVAAIGLVLGSADTRAAQKDIVDTAVERGPVQDPCGRPGRS